MEQFNLDTWLKDKSRRVITRRGNIVRIICTDRKHGEDDLPIVFLEENNGGEFLLTCRNDGRCNNYDTQYDLFFADKEELTEFERKLKFLCSAFQHVDSSSDDVINGVIQDYAKDLLDLARNEEILKDSPTEKERITKEEFKERLENLVREYDWSYDDKWKFFSTDERQHAMYIVDINIIRRFRLE